MNHGVDKRKPTSTLMSKVLFGNSPDRTCEPLISAVLIKKVLLFLLAPIFFGALIYLFYRQPDFAIVEWLGLRASLENWAVRDKLPNMPGWFVYNLPDGLWMFSFTYAVLMILKFPFRKKQDGFILLLPVLVSLIGEISQLCELVQGTFDFMDILFYLIGFTTPIALNLKKIKNN